MGTWGEQGEPGRGEEEPGHSGGLHQGEGRARWCWCGDTLVLVRRCADASAGRRAGARLGRSRIETNLKIKLARVELTIHTVLRTV